MSFNLLETVQKDLGYPSLKKVNPNTLDVAADRESQLPQHNFAQAAIPTTLIGLYKYSLEDAGADNLLRGNISTSWANALFGTRENEVVEKINQYAGSGIDDTGSKINEIAADAVKRIREHLKAGSTIKEVKILMADQRNNILPYLPGVMHLGNTVNDDTIDDSTTKMEGPVSNLMKAIGNKFSKPITEKDLNDKELNY